MDVGSRLSTAHIGRRAAVHIARWQGVYKPMASLTTDALRQALRAIADPASGRDIVSAGLVDSLELRGGMVHLALRTNRARAAEMEGMRRDAEGLLARQPGVQNATVVLTAHRDAAPEPQPVPPGAKPRLLPEVRHVVAVASGKGGVGKSTTAVNLAVSLSRP